MHTLQPKHTRLKNEEIKEITEKFNVVVSQLPKIKSTDPALPEGCNRGDVVKIERSLNDKVRHYYRVIV